MFKEFLKFHLILIAIYASAIRFIFLENHTIEDAFVEFKKRPKRKSQKPVNQVKDYLNEMYKKS